MPESATVQMEKAARDLVESIRKEGAANVRGGRPGILSPGSEIGERFEAAHLAWTRLRWDAGDATVRHMWPSRP